MRKAMSLLLTAGILMSEACYAATISEITFKSGIAHVSGTAENDKTISVMAVKKDDSESMGLIHEATAEEDGTYSFDFVINDLPDGTNMSGWYTLRVTDGQTAEKDFYFATEKGINDFLTAVENAIDNDNEEEYKNAFEATDEKILECLGMDFSAYADIEDEITEAMFANTADGSISKESIYNDYTKAVGYVLLNQGDGDGLEIYNPEFDGKEFCELADTDVTFIKEVMTDNAPYVDYEELEESYSKAYALSKVNAASSSKLAGVLADYEKLLDLSSNSDYKYYKTASASVKAAISEDIVDALYSDKAYSEDELAEVIEKAVKANKPNTSTGGSSGGGGGSSRGSGGSAGGFSISGATSGTQNTEPNNAEIETAVFNDLDDAAWAETAILFLYDKGIVNGVGNGLFEPNRYVTREEFVKMIVAALGYYDENAECDFSDTGKNEWYYPYVATAYSKGIVTGYTDNTFGIGKNLLREEAAAMLARCIEDSAVVREYTEFADDAEISSWAKEEVIKLYCAGIINGSDGKFYPGNILTRAESAQMLYGYLKGGV